MRRVLLSTLVAALPAVAMAADAERVVEARKGFFSLVALEFGPLAAMAKGEMPYDADAAKAHAADLVALTKYNPSDLYAPGTSADDVKGTGAKAAIWQDMDAYQKKGMAFFEAVAALEPVAGNGQKELGAAVNKVGATCKSCHDDFRAKN
ncbi:cytochrome c [Cereibacter azotoformans]|uniref:Cytochrome c, class II n=1 Tax=Cereibacter sphaeroides (strain ATCC 17025 / ATH 2.4.3) TaxID=349102 RepID=A4WV71_CERS5|nr:cytochrome c [Cereibacter azotoformans]ULB10501.1 cytochrome c [Cereibacter azotoformans]